MAKIFQQRWKTVEYSTRQINDAGKTIRKNDASEDELKFATKVIDNWRAAHAYPLHVIYMHLRGMAASRKDILVVERLKRLDSIIGKLKRETGMDLWRMQDLGGCRVIVPTVEEVFAFAERYKNSRVRHEYKRTYDYINNPKASGYRSLHLVYKFHSDTKDTYNRNMLIEIQFRTHLQHVWATALETMGLFTKQALKAGQGDEYVKRFFVLVSSLFAIKEGCPVIPGTSSNPEDLISEVKRINNAHHLVDILRAIRVALDHEDGKRFDKQGYYVLILNYNTHRLRIRYFLPSKIDEANTLYTQIESNRRATGIDAVLVRADSFGVLKAAYPNYFADIGEFVSLVEGYLK